MKSGALILSCMLALCALTAPARAETICTLVIDAGTGATMHETGDCDRRVTPASTFKLPLAVMGFDSGLLTDSSTPTLPFVEGYPDWISAWRRDTGPARWMEHSVVWYSQAITKALGAEKLTAYGRAFNYGNADFSGDAGQNNGLERSWISSSLLISPREQATFIADLLNNALPVSSQAIDKTRAIIQAHDAGGGWTFSGKTGSAYPRRADGAFDRGRGWGWYVGWATRDDQVLIIIRLDQADGPGHPTGGIHVRNELIAAWPSLAAQF